MKQRGLLLIAVVALLLALAGMVLPAGPAFAYSEDIDLDPDSADVGDRVDIDGEGFDESDAFDTYYARIYFSADEAEEGDEIDYEVENYEIVKTTEEIDEDGEFSTYFYVPDELTDGEDDEDVGSGDYYVYVTYHDDDEIVAVAEFTVGGAEIRLSTRRGPVGTTVQITGDGFSKSEDITVEYDNDDISIRSGDKKTDSRGEFECSIVIPASTEGDHTITVTDDDDAEGETEFTVEPKVTADPAQGRVGETVELSGTGFADRADVTVDFDNNEVADDQTDRDGSFSVTFTVPAKGSGSYEIEAWDDEGNFADTDFSIEVEMTLAPGNGHVGSQVTVTGDGFAPNSAVTITYEAGNVATAATDGAGRFSTTFSVPKSLRGPHTVTASDSSGTSLSATFVMESTPPPIPAPVAPTMDANVGSKPRFEWGVVQDPSGVSYVLQVAEDQAFSVVLVEKSGITAPEYILTEAEKLEGSSKESPYWWRVRAADGAGNASGWSTPVSFSVGFSLSFLSDFFENAGWFGYTLIGLIALLIIVIIGMVLRRRPEY